MRREEPDHRPAQIIGNAIEPDTGKELRVRAAMESLESDRGLGRKPESLDEMRAQVLIGIAVGGKIIVDKADRAVLVDHDVGSIAIAMRGTAIEACRTHGRGDTTNIPDQQIAIGG